MIVSIQGNIGCGKSTLVDQMKIDLEIARNSWRFVEEPVKEWSKFRDSAGNDILTLFYENPRSYAFTFQMMAYISRLDVLKSALWSLPQVVVSERSLEADKEVFERMLHTRGDISKIEHEVYNRWFDHFAKDCTSNKIIYLRCDPAVAHSRIRKRNRQGENITLQYLRQCHAAHEEWLTKIDQSKLLILDANQDLIEDPRLHSKWIAQICDFIDK